MTKTNKILIIVSIILTILLITQSVLFIVLPDWSKDNVKDPVITEEPFPGIVRGRVLTDNGSMSNAGIIIEDENGNTRRINCNFLSGYKIQLKPGNYLFHFTRGFEYSIVTKEVKVESYRIINMQDVRLVQLFDSYTKGWIGGDLHQHSTFSDGANNVDDVLLSNINTGMYYGFLSDHNSAEGLAEWMNGKHNVAFTDNEDKIRYFNPYEAVEVTTEYGHFQSLGVGMTFDQYEVVLRDYERSLPKTEKDELIKNRIIYIAEEIKRAGGVAQINHPYSSSTMGFNYWEVADYFDTVEIWNGVFVPGDGRYEGIYKEQNYKSKIKWFELLNNIKNGGRYIPATGGSDNHEISSPFKNSSDSNIVNITNMEEYRKAYEKAGKYSAQPTTYIHIPDIDSESLTLEKTLNAIRSGHSFISNGPIVIADINGKSYGESTAAANGNAIINIEAFNRDGLTDIRIIKNGEVINTISINAINYSGYLNLSGLVSGDWILLEGLGNGVNYAITNPIFIM